MSLTEFLLARIAEDEAVADACGPGWSGPESMGAVEGGETVLVDPARVLADCEAKRVLVSRFLETCAADQSSGTFATAWRERLDALEILALPHANHPDFREEWRP